MSDVVCNFSWDMKTSQEKSKTTPMQFFFFFFFFFWGGGGGVKEVYYRICASREQELRIVCPSWAVMCLSVPNILLKTFLFVIFV